MVSAHITKVQSAKREQLDLRFVGLNSETNEHIEWLNTPLKLGDKISFEIKEIEANSSPNKVEIKTPKDAIMEGKLHAYQMLKKELEEAGVIW